MADIEQLRGQIKRRIFALEETQTQLKLQKEGLKEQLLNDEDYKDLKEKAELAAKRAAACKEALLNEPQYTRLSYNIKASNQELKDLNAMLTGELFAYTKQTDLFQIETPDGELRNIQYKAKLVKTNQPTLI